MAEVTAVDPCRATTYCLLDQIYIDYMAHVEAFIFGLSFMYRQFVMAKAPPGACRLEGYTYGCRLLDVAWNEQKPV
jgi:hypothetical protein